MNIRTKLDWPLTSTEARRKDSPIGAKVSSGESSAAGATIEAMSQRHQAPEAIEAGAKKNVLEQLNRILNSTTFREAGRLKRFLECIVRETVDGRGDELKEYVVAVQVFDKKTSFDPRTDPIVRVQARRLRVMLERYYHDEGAKDSLVIDLPKGGYAPIFKARQVSPPRPAAVNLVARNTFAVLPFADCSPTSDLDFFCRGLRQEIICALSRLSNVRIFADANSPEYTVAHSTSAVVVSGSVRRSGDLLRVSSQIIDGPSGCYIWSEAVDGNLQDALTLQSAVAERMLERLQAGAGVAGWEESWKHGPAVNLAARNLYIQGRYHLNERTEEGLRKAVDFFQRALQEDPQYALAHSGLADVYILLGNYGVLAPAEIRVKAASSSAAAVMLDASSVEAHTSLAHVKASQDWDWAGAEAQFREALRIDPRYATAHHWYALSCLAPQGRLDEALDEMLMAQSLDPVSAIIARDVAVIYCYRREFNAALEQCDHTIELNRHFSPAFWTLGLIQEQRHDYEEAAAAFQRAVHLSPNSPRMQAALGHLYAVTGERESSLKIIEELKVISASRYVSPFEFGSIYFALGMTEEAFEWFDRACRDRCFELLSINVDPRFELLRRDPRFESIARQVGLVART
jgi:TolB-like protein/Tfp pilus assembly protein PilF